MILRDYQIEALAHIEARRLAGDTRVPLVLATGLGKTQIFTAYADRWLAEHQGQRVLIIAHTDELITQATKRMRQVAPGRRIGIVKGTQHNDVLAEIIISSRQTLGFSARRSQLHRVGLIIIDEAHHAVRTNTYGRILDHFGAFDEHPGVFVLGFTATLARSDKAKLSSIWQDCTFVRDIIFGIRNGYLLDVRGERIIVPDLDMSNVRVTRGDYSESDVAEELERTFAPEVIAKEYARLASIGALGEDAEEMPAQYRRGIAFWPLVDTAFHGAKAFDEEGIRSGVVHGGTPKSERRESLQRFHLPLNHSEAIDVMHNAMVLTEGFDEPSADVVVIARPTRSAPLYQQMVGRVLRPDLTIPADRRDRALILDVTGAGEDHNLRSLIDLSPERKLKPKPDDESASLLELDEYLLEIEAELDAQRARGGFDFDSPMYAGVTQTKAFDPLGRNKVWGQTPEGTYYISAGGTAYVFVTESALGDPGTYDVVMCSKINYQVTPWQRGTEHQGLSLDMALSWGEEIAINVGGPGTITLTNRKAPWRRLAPKETQVYLAGRLGIDVTGMNRGQVSEAIDANQAALRIDPLVTIVRQAIREREARERDEERRK